MKIRHFEDLDAWKAARKLAICIYELTGRPEFNRDVELRRQMNDAANSAMANIAEGFDSGSDLEFARYLRISKRSAGEVQSHLYTALDRKHIAGPDFERGHRLAEDVKGLSGGLIRYLDRRRPRPARKA